MFKSLGNIAVNPNVGLLFIDMHEKPRRLRVNGTATVSRDDPLLGSTVGAQLIVRVQARAIFPNCPRYIPKLTLAEPSVYVPQPGCEPPEPAWKGFDMFKDAVHPRQPTYKGPAEYGVRSRPRAARASCAAPRSPTARRSCRSSDFPTGCSRSTA